MNDDKPTCQCILCGRETPYDFEIEGWHYCRDCVMNPPRDNPELVKGCESIGK